MISFSRVIFLLVSCFFLSACSDDNSSQTQSNNDHVWKEQTETINKAKEVERMLMDSAQDMQNAIENQE